MSTYRHTEGPRGVSTVAAVRFPTGAYLDERADIDSLVEDARSWSNATLHRVLQAEPRTPAARVLRLRLRDLLAHRLDLTEVQK